MSELHEEKETVKRHGKKHEDGKKQLERNFKKLEKVIKFA